MIKRLVILITLILFFVLVIYSVEKRAERIQSATFKLIKKGESNESGKRTGK